jgi:hypothetical protein
VTKLVITPDCAFMILIAAPGIGACVESRTTPVMLPEPTCARAGVNNRVIATAAANPVRRDRRNNENNGFIMLLISNFCFLKGKWRAAWISNNNSRVQDGWRAALDEKAIC